MAQFIDPAATEEMIAQRIMSYDPRYFTTYYAIDAVNFTAEGCVVGAGPAGGALLPLVVQEAAGLPLDPSFTEQKKILQRCHGLFFAMRRRRRGAALQPAADRRRVDQGNGVPLVCAGGQARPRGGGMSDGAGGVKRTHRGAAAVALTDVDITFRLAGGGSYAAVQRASLEVADGEFVAIVGPTGCGKSTLLNVTAGLFPPSQGRVEIFGAALPGLNRQSGYLFQADALFPWKTALENVAIGLETAGTPREEARAPRAGVARRASASARSAARYPHMLSGGQRKRVGLAQVLIRDPKILLMDEPFGPLDAQTRQIMGNLLLDLWSADRKAVLFVTHDLEEAIALSDRVVIMSAGPAARIIGDWRVPLPRPRDIAEVKLDPAFHQLHRDIWQTLKAEVMKGYAQTGG